jgi:hypothetical protein
VAVIWSVTLASSQLAKLCLPNIPSIQVTVLQAGFDS